MSLTRAQWEEMWESIKKIERIATNSQTLSIEPKNRILTETAKMKKAVESVIGQME